MRVSVGKQGSTNRSCNQAALVPFVEESDVTKFIDDVMRKNDVGQIIVSSYGYGSLAISEQGLTDLAPSIGDVKQLAWLTVEHNSLSSLREQIGTLTELGSLDASYNQLTTLPDLSALQKLTTLVLDNNRLTHVPKHLPHRAFFERK